jgi:predicted RND superfamily exporter protein
MYISLIGLLISSGAFFSMLMVLLLLPALLMNLDRWIVRKKKSSDQILSETNEF